MKLLNNCYVLYSGPLMKFMHVCYKNSDETWKEKNLHFNIS